MSARRPTTILPAMTLAEAIETTHIHSVAGLTGGCTALTVTSQGLAPPGPYCPCRPERWPSCKKRHPALSAASFCSLVPVHGQVGVIFHEQRRGPVRLPGQVSWAHHGVLLLEAFPECRHHVLGVVDRQG
jgi:predicted ATPase with chaperone activity